MKINKLWFSLIELLVAITIFGMVILWWFYALSAVTLWKIKLIEKTDINKEAFYFSEKLFEEIKSWWVIDFEEYFNRFVVWNTTSSWHFSQATWFWNSWTTSWFYFCRSWIWDVNFMWTWGCYNNTFNNFSATQIWSQRYWQYTFNFIDYNSNYDWDWWDQDNNWEFRWDDDDENLWEWPIVFTWWQDVKELYLISGDRKTRTFIRWNWKLDPAKTKPVWSTCDWSITNFTRAWSGCIWTVQILKLVWKDLWFNHIWTLTWAYDWIIDTWEFDPNFAWWNPSFLAWNSWIDAYWQDLFPDNISVKDFKIFLYPNKDRVLSFKDLTESTNINQYARLQMILTPSRKKRWGMKWEIPQIKIATTINLTDYFSK